MSTLATDTPLSSATFAGELTTTLVPTVTRIDTRLDISPVSVVLAVSIVCILSPITVTGNSIILAAFYRYKRLRTASNCLLVSLAISDFGIGLFMPVGMQLELSGLPENGVSALCIVPYCIAIALCSVSVLVTVAIAVDRLTSLAQPLRYKNIITHSSVEKYIAVFWIYAIAVGLSPLIYAQAIGEMQLHSGSCRFDAAVLPPVRVFLVVAVWAPSALVLLGCYMYVYLVARAHARAIYTVELSFRHQTQTLALPRYGQTLAVTVGAFLILWLPFQIFVYNINNMESGYIIKDNARITAKDVPNSNASSECICYRPHSNIICNGCGFWTRGRVRYCCPQHPKIVFLHDHAQCPRCRSYDFMLKEI